MEDEMIIGLLFIRDEKALFETEEKYGHLMKSIASNILQNYEDCEECCNEALLRLWNNVPPARPNSLSAYLSRLTRNIALNMVDSRNAKKRRSDRFATSYEELSEAIDSEFSVEKEYDRKQLNFLLEKFLKDLSEVESKVFIGKYFFFESYEKISRRTGLSVKKVRNLSEKTRKKLAGILKKEGYDEY